MTRAAVRSQTCSRTEAAITIFGFRKVSMDDFIHRENIAHYKRLLAESGVTTDHVRHKELTRLLAAEMAKEVEPPSK
jgi:hypothetical protein